MSKPVTAVFFCLVAFGVPSGAARSPKPKDEVAKIAVGPKNEKSSAAETQATEGDPNLSETSESDDAPKLKPIVAAPLVPDDTPAPVAPGQSLIPVLESSEEVETETNDVANDVAKPTEPTITLKKKPAVSESKPAVKSAAKYDFKSKARPKATLTDKSAPKSSTKSAANPKPKTAAVETVAAPTPVESGNISAEQSLKWLTNGNTRFITKKFRADGRSPADRARVANEQKPHAIVLSCSDSRVPPELIFDQGLGEITTIRVAGEVLDASVIASIETAIQKEHPRLLVVLGHTQCESIEAALNWKEKATNGSDALDRMVAEIKPHLHSLAPGAPSAGLQVEAVLQADGVARDLADHSEIIKNAVESHELTIKTGLYWVDTGQVKFY